MGTRQVPYSRRGMHASPPAGAGRGLGLSELRSRRSKARTYQPNMKLLTDDDQTIELTADAFGWLASVGGVLWHVTATATGPHAVQ